MSLDDGILALAEQMDNDHKWTTASIDEWLRLSGFVLGFERPLKLGHEAGTLDLIVRMGFGFRWDTNSESILKYFEILQENTDFICAKLTAEFL